MKRFFPILIFAMAAYVGCVVWQNYGRKYNPEAVIDQPAAAPEVVAAVPPAPAGNFAPEGVYFLLERVSVMTDSGVIGDPPGTKVTLVKAGPPMRVTDGKNEFDVTPAQVTNDLDAATRVFYADQAALAQINSMNAMRAQQAREASKQHEAESKAWTAQQLARAAATPTPTSSSFGALDQGAQAVNQPGVGGGYRSRIH